MREQPCVKTAAKRFIFGCVGVCVGVKLRQRRTWWSELVAIVLSFNLNILSLLDIWGVTSISFQLLYKPV